MSQSTPLQTIQVPPSLCFRFGPPPPNYEYTRGAWMLVRYIWRDREYRMYEIDCRVSNDSEYGREVYANTLECFHQIQYHVKKVFFCNRYVDELPFLVYQNSNKYTPKTNIVIDDACLTPFPQRVQSIFIQHKEKIECIGLILKVFYKFQVCVAYLVQHTGLSSA